MTVKYDRVVNTLYRTVEEGFEDIFADEVKKLQIKVNKIHKTFFKKFVNKVIDVKAAPNLGEYTPTWLPLNKNYVSTKRKLGQSSNFFMKTGELKTSLSRLNPKTVLGTPVVLYTPAGLRGTPGVTVRQEKWRGQQSKRRVIRDSKGRFAKSSEVFRSLKASISIDPYPKIIQDIRNNQINEDDLFSKDIADKLKNPGGRRLRPAISNFLNWFLEKELRKAVKL